MHQFEAEQFLPITKEKAWDFFSSPQNLSLITPPELEFKIVSKLNGKDIFEGMKIDYTVKPILGISIQWQTEIYNVKYHTFFTDIQVKGPYKIWEHTHTFSEFNGGVLMNDLVNYKLPFGFVGRILNSILIKRKIENIFNYRKKVLKTLFY